MTEASYSRWLADEVATQHVGQNLARVLSSPVHIYLQGDIGAGKTTLVRAMLQNLGVRGAIKSPTFAMVEPYILSQHAIYHFDLYRLTDPEELEYLAWRDYFAEVAMCCVEWPERAMSVLPSPDLWIAIAIEGNGRQITITAASARGSNMLKALIAIMEDA